MTSVEPRLDFAERFWRASYATVSWLAAVMIPLVLVSQVTLRLRSPLGVEGAAAAAYGLLFPLVAGLQGGVVAALGGRGLRWSIATLLSLVGAMAVAVATMATADGHGSETLWMLASWCLGGLVMGAGQRIGGRGWLVRPGRWLIATVAGWVGGAGIWSLLWMWREPLSRWLPWRSALGGLDIPGNVELSMIAVTFVVYAVSTSPLLASTAVQGDAE
jgi:hypothetical protein